MTDHSNANDMPTLKQDFYARPADQVAPDLIGCYLFTTIDGKRVGGMIIETEAYDQRDPFAHCHPNATAYWRKESKPMLFAPGNIYIYYSSQLPCLRSSRCLLKLLRQAPKGEGYAARLWRSMA